jgi:Chaperone of endosialidase
MTQKIPSSSLKTQSTITSAGTSGSPATISGYWQLNQTLKGSIDGTAGKADRLTYDKTINGVIFNGTQNITVHTAGTGIGIGANGTDINNTGIVSVTNGTGVTTSGKDPCTISIGQEVGTDKDVRFNSIGVGIAAPGSSSIVAQGNITAYSDRRLKNDITIIDNALNKLIQVNGVTYTRIDLEDTQKRYTGVIAQELEAVLPEAVMTDAEGIKSVAYGNVIGLLIESIKELNNKIEHLEKIVGNSK